MNRNLMNELRRKLTAAIPLLVYCVFYMTYFSILEKSDFRNYHVPYCPLDAHIPFIPYFIVPYFLWFAFVPLIVAAVLFTDEKLYRRTSAMLMIGMSIFLLISTLFPTRLFLRPQVTGTTIFDQAVRFLYSTDTPTNVFPSIHVYNTSVVLWAVWKSRSRILGNIPVRAASTILSVLIVLATVFLRQHSVIDVAGGLAMFGITAGVYAYADRRAQRRSRVIGRQSRFLRP